MHHALLGARGSGVSRIFNVYIIHNIVVPCDKPVPKIISKIGVKRKMKGREEESVYTMVGGCTGRR